MGSLVLVVPFFLLLQVFLRSLLDHLFLLSEVPQLQGQRHHPHEQFIVDFVFLVLGAHCFEVLQQFVGVSADAHVLEDGLHAQSTDQFSLRYGHVELFLQLHQFGAGVQLVERDMPGAVDGPVASHLLDRLL